MIRIYVLGKKGLLSLRSMSDIQLKLIESVVVGLDKNVINDYSEEIISYCKKKRLRYWMNNNEPEPKSDYLIAIGWRWLIKTNLRLIVFHDSLLPRYRGFAPLVSTLINGESEIGATALFANGEFDTGDIIEQQRISIEYPIKIEMAIELISGLYARMMISIVEKIRSGKIVGYAQEHSDASYSLWRNSDDYFIDWNWESKRIKRFIDATGFPYLGARTKMDEQVFLIFDSELANDVKIENRDVGKILFKDDTGFTIVCGAGLLKIAQFYSEDMKLIDLNNKFRLKFK